MDLNRTPQYELVEKRTMKELASEGYLLRHKKTGARVFLLENSDANKVFNIAFRTTPTDSTGVAHIIEHTVLCGSEKYPAKDPFVELAKGSLNTFLNAMTYSDKTMYPLASTNDKDFRNLMSVYMDAVFHPNILKERKIFEQEGWHYELEDAEGELIYNGVVYNEMKGAFSSADEVLARNIQKHLFPDNTYTHESGGDPEFIPDLTYEAYLDFYHKYYHPSNSYLYLYGDMDMAEVLNWLDEEYLSHYDKAVVDSEILPQEPFAQMKEIQIAYAASSGEDEGTYFSWNKVVGTALDRNLYLAFQVLDYVLLGAPGAPVKQALLDAGIGVDIYGGYEDGILQPYFQITAKGAKEAQKEAFVQTIRETLSLLVEQGLHKKSLLAGINSLEFKLREADFGRWPKGLMYGLEAFGSWLYDENDPFLLLETEETMAFLREQIQGRYYEELIQKWLLDNTFGLVVTAVPQEDLEEQTEAAVQARLKAYRDTLSREELEAIAVHTRELKEYQETPSTKEVLETIPMLHISDIQKEVLPLYNELRSLEKTEILFHEMFTSGIGYLDLIFDCGFLTLEEMPYLSLLKSLIGMVDTEAYSYRELSDEINIHTGDIQCGFSILQPQEQTLPSMTFSLRLKALYGELETAVDLAAAMMLTSDLEDDKRLQEILGELQSQLHERLKSAGHGTAIKRSCAGISASCYLNEITSGIEFCTFVDDLYRNYEQRKDLLKAKLKDICSRLFRTENLFVSYTADAEGYEALCPVLSKLMHRLPAEADLCAEKNLQPEALAHAEWNVPLTVRREGFGCASQIQFVARTGNYLKAGLPYTGALLVLQNILNYDYLWIRLRVKGGAYGCMSGFGRDGDSYLCSYLDPKLAETNEVYEQLPQYLREFSADSRDMERYIIGTISEMDVPKNPAALGARGLTAYQLGITGEQLQMERDQVLHADAAVIRGLAAYAEAVLADNSLCVVGNETKIRENAELFDQIQSL